MGSHSTGFFEESEPAAVFAVLLSVGTEFVHLLDSGFSAYLPDQRHLHDSSIFNLLANIGKFKDFAGRAPEQRATRRFCAVANFGSRHHVWSFIRVCCSSYKLQANSNESEFEPEDTNRTVTCALNPQLDPPRRLHVGMGKLHTAQPKKFLARWLGYQRAWQRQG